jgi:hypothetical protein
MTDEPGAPEADTDPVVDDGTLAEKVATETPPTT